MYICACVYVPKTFEEFCVPKKEGSEIGAGRGAECAGVCGGVYSYRRWT